MYQFYEAQLPVFLVNVEIIVRNVTINDVQFAKFELRVWHSANFVYIKLFQNKNSILMSTLLNKRAKFGAKIFRHY